MQLGYTNDYGSSQGPARRYLAQLALWCAVAAVPFLLLSRKEIRPSSLFAFGLMFLCIWLAGLGVAVWEASRGISVAATLAILLGSLSEPFQQLTATMGARAIETFCQQILPGLLISLAIGLLAYWVDNLRSVRAIVQRSFQKGLAFELVIICVVAVVVGFIVGGAVTATVACTTVLLATPVIGAYENKDELGYSLIFILVGAWAAVTAVIVAGVMVVTFAGVDLEYYARWFAMPVMLVAGIGTVLLVAFGIGALTAAVASFGFAIGAVIVTFGLPIQASGIASVSLADVVGVVMAVVISATGAIGVASAMALVVYLAPIGLGIFVVFVITLLLAVGLEFLVPTSIVALPLLPTMLMMIVGFFVGTLLGSKDGKRNIPWFRLGSLAVIGWAFLGSAPINVALWLMACFIGFFRLPVYLVDLGYCVVRHQCIRRRAN